MLPFILNCGKYLIVVLFFLITSLTSAAPNSSSEPCDESNPVCLKNAIQKALPYFARGIPELGVEVLDPFRIEKLDFNLTGGLKIQFRDGHAKGTRKCVVEHARVFEDTIDTRFLCNLTIKGKYRSSGRLLMFPINGDGDAAIKCRNLRISTVLKVRSVPGPVSTHLEVLETSRHHSYDGRIYYNLTNLLKGSPQASKIILEFMNQNWQLVAQEFGDPIVEFGLDVILRNIKKLFSVMPMNKLFAKWEPISTKLKN